MLAAGGPPFVIDRFEPRDLVAVLRLAQASLGEEIPYNFLIQMSTLRPEFCKVAREPATGRVVGFTIGTKEGGHEGRVLLLAVDPSLQGRGVGRELLRSLQRELALRDVKQVRLEVRADNERAIHFYERLGYNVTGLQEHAYKDGQDAFWMMKPLR